MRTSALLLVLAATISAEEWRPLTLEELGGSRLSDKPTPTDHLFLLRAGVQSLAGNVNLLLNDTPYELSDRKGSRTHVEGMVLVQPYEMRPGLMLGLGVSRTYWGLGDNAALVAKHINAIGGVVMPLTRSNAWRVELLGYEGIGQADVGDNVVNSQSRERGFDLGLVFPVYRPWRLEGGLTAGKYWSETEAGDITVVKSGTTFPVTLDLDAKGVSYGFSLTWRP